ncbi:cytochrome P450 2J6-like [Paramacrobiotus metropolitanus]|uniref:cytochrome P450 2J6-like n=1 Tax=Paramacrobiotus metropolitanus TaxID=2943436 RepID=UPI0024456279|nr:cytochrome P450 2J6-like [Paramacrobiotus metropolitanus]
MMIPLWLFLSGIVAALLAAVFLRRRNPKLPPGPTGLPVLGNLLNLGSNPPEQLAKWSKEYGGVMSVQLGIRDMVMITDADTAKTVFNDENTAGRDQYFILNTILKGKGLAASEGELWREHRRFALSTLRDLGMGKTWFEDDILENIGNVCQIFRDHANQPFDPHRHLTLAISNAICALVFGRRFEHTDEKFLHLSNLFEENLRILNVIAPIQFLPFLRYVPFGKIHDTWNEFFGNVGEIQRFVKCLIESHKSRPDFQSKIEEKGDYIDNFFIVQNQEKAKSDSTFTEEQLTVSLLNLFAAGTSTTNSTILWAFIYMVKYPEVQKKVHEEIDNKIGRDRPIRMEDRPSLHYCDAVTLEVQRLGSVAPMGVPHTNIDEMKINGYEIPARSLLVLNTYAMHRDPRYWSHPKDFHPEHFLDKDGSVFIPKGFAPFGIGKRSCPGESLAKMETYLFFTNIMQRFSVSAVPGNEPDPNNFSVSFLRTPKPYEIIFTPRT